MSADHPALATDLSSLLRQTARQLMRDLRAGELRLLLLAVTLAVTALSAVGFFADRLQGALARDAAQMLGGERVVVGDVVLPAQWVAEARSAGLLAVTTATFPSMARAPEAQGGAMKLVALKAAEAGYPLRGVLKIRTEQGQEQILSHGPQPGTVWLDPGLPEVLGLKPGDELVLGERRLRIAGLLIEEPDRGAGFSAFSPRVLMHASDLPSTGLVQPASRITWRLMVARPTGPQEAALLPALQRWAQGIEARIAAESLRGVRLDSIETGRPEMRQTLDRASQFLHLVAILTALLAAVAVAIAARGFAQRHLDACALLRVLGQSQRRIAAVYALEFLGVGLIGSLIGLGLGLALHQVFVELLARLVLSDLPAPGWGPVGFGLGVGLTLLTAFGLPPVLQLAQVPPLRVLRRDLGATRPASLGVLAAGLGGFAGLIFQAAEDRTLGAITVLGFAGAWTLFAGLTALLLTGLRRGLGDRSPLPAWLRLALRQLAARPGWTTVQVGSLGLGLLALGLLVVLRTDLIEGWRNATPADAPNRFVINILPDQTEAFQQRLKQAGVSRHDWSPMIRGRLISVNGRDVKPEDYAAERARRLVDREFNLSHMAELPSHNQVSAGRWQPEEKDAISVESGLADTLGLKLGDRLGFDVGGQRLEGRITSLRKLDWTSMRVNFFVLFPQTRLADDPPSTWIAAYRDPPAQGGQPSLDSRLLREFPNLTSVDVSAQVAQVQRVLDQVIRAIEFLFAFTLVAGLTVLLATLGASRGTRERELALMRSMGASSGLLRRMLGAEVIGIGLLAGTVAMALVLGLGELLARQVLGFDWHPRPWLPLAGALGGALLAWGAGWWSLRGVLQRPVTATLRDAARE
jgi:putative ABC transport system permease protein